MSTNPPPTGPPSGPEFLESGSGGPIPASGGTTSGGRKTATIAGGALVGLAAVGGGGFFAWSAFFGVGAQPAEALPAGTLGYVSIDANPSGSQKIEALKTLNKFPGIKDEVGLTSDGDIKKRIFEEIQSDGTCEDVDFEDDIEPWLGDRFAIAAVDIGNDEPAPVFVVQVKDAEAADAGLTTLQTCDEEEGADLEGGWVIEDGWALVAETTDIAEDVADAAADDGTLAADDDFQKWTGEAGDPGIITAYASPDAGAFIAEAAGVANDAVGQDDFSGGELPSLTPDVPDELLDALKDFGGAGLTVRFDDGSLEVETAAETGLFGFGALTAGDTALEAISTLPGDTAGAFGIGFEEGWFDEALDYAAEISGGEVDLEEAIGQIEDETGLKLPEDAETLAGESAVFAVGPELDAERFFNSDDGSDVPVGVKIKGDGDAISDIIGQIAETAGDGVEDIFGTDADGDYIAIGPNEDYRKELLKDGDLGDTDTFKDVIREDDLNSVLFINFDAGDNWLAELAGEGDDEIKENIEPLSGLGLISWSDGDVGHSVLRITTD